MTSPSIDDGVGSANPPSEGSEGGTPAHAGYSASSAQQANHEMAMMQQHQIMLQMQAQLGGRGGGLASMPPAGAGPARGMISGLTNPPTSAEVAVGVLGMGNRNQPVSSTIGGTAAALPTYQQLQPPASLQTTNFSPGSGGAPYQRQPDPGSTDGISHNQLAAMGLNPATALAQLRALQQQQQLQAHLQQPQQQGTQLFQQQQHQLRMLMGNPGGLAGAIGSGGSETVKLAAVAGLKGVGGVDSMGINRVIAAPLVAPILNLDRCQDVGVVGSGGVIASGGRGKEPPFPVKFHRILSNPEFRDIISWLPHGRSWRVLKPKAFEERIIPLYFRHGKYASFMRQVSAQYTLNDHLEIIIFKMLAYRYTYLSLLFSNRFISV